MKGEGFLVKKIFLQLVVAILFIGILPLNSHALEGTEPIKFDVVALGDSLAVGVTPQNEMGPGYGDFLARKLAEIDQLKSFNKGFAYPGYKTTDLLKDLADNVVKPSMNEYFMEGEKGTISDAIKEAEVIVMSIGANDVLANVKVLEDGTLDYDLATVQQAIQNTAKNIGQVLAEIKKINPDAHALFMGYYNPFPYNTTNSFALGTMVNLFDNAVKPVVENAGGKFIVVKEKVAENYLTYLPNPANIHLSEAGYEFVAGLMYNELPLIYIADNPDQYPIDIAGHWGENFIKQGIDGGLFNGYEDKTFRPENPLTRLEMAALLNRGLKLPASNKEMEFKDLSKSYAPMVEELRAVYAAGIVKGDGTGNFRPNDHITREQMALMILRAHIYMYGEYTPEGPTPYKDIDKLSAESQKAISYLYENGIIDEADKYNPHNKLTRAQAAKMLVGFVNQ